MSFRFFMSKEKREALERAEQFKLETAKFKQEYDAAMASLEERRKSRAEAQKALKEFVEFLHGVKEEVDRQEKLSSSSSLHDADRYLGSRPGMRFPHPEEPSMGFQFNPYREAFRVGTLASSGKTQSTPKPVEKIPARLRFDVRFDEDTPVDHIEIIIGNPVTLCKLTNQHTEDNREAVAVLNPKDKYNWKTGAVQSLTNLMKGWPPTAKALYYEKMFKKYPTLKVR